MHGVIRRGTALEQDAGDHEQIGIVLSLEAGPANDLRRATIRADDQSSTERLPSPVVLERDRGRPTGLCGYTDYARSPPYLGPGAGGPLEQGFLEIGMINVEQRLPMWRRNPHVP